VQPVTLYHFASTEAVGVQQDCLHNGRRCRLVPQPGGYACWRCEAPGQHAPAAEQKARERGRSVSVRFVREDVWCTGAAKARVTPRHFHMLQR
jgi:hypothetical protein